MLASKKKISAYPKGRDVIPVELPESIPDRKIRHRDHSFSVEAIEEFTGVLVKLVEMKDRYTAEHQKRVARLAEAIARQMEFPEKDINGIKIASLIHDVGKMAVPAELLARPARLSNVERKLVMAHVKAGYNLVKDVEFSWPVATMILQHHEKMDGSGYPYGLRGDEILVQSQVIAVADVVDAMTHSHPYRVAFTIEQAMEEITTSKGFLYHKDVVEAFERTIISCREFCVASEY